MTLHLLWFYLQLARVIVLAIHNLNWVLIT